MTFDLVKLTCIHREDKMAAEKNQPSAEVDADSKYTITLAGMWESVLEHWQPMLCVFLGVLIPSIRNLDVMVGSQSAYYIRGFGQLFFFLGCLQVGQIFVKQVKVEGSKFKEVEEAKKAGVKKDS
ncbi:hypothetical protein SARC_02264 [Sphaeroforma arctica JP610]|uniref:Uncharacterized protein n=1 Tax=Sphaeroforma arctica JP610 TaxID=667725 RepID=A0A0L0G937_9EUKA|nr:hypothetical protein SARC_02264 [Sphaeroforma arctica JP610]KNC85542.1 hypothetical protein SARC_02264 [Sphaeroforma arctica JP610]|eukprot:XP_014159444.1 hypothetical protein SARC_02264 [Sphaeroforma arctica JP610]